MSLSTAPAPQGAILQVLSETMTHRHAVYLNQLISDEADSAPALDVGGSQYFEANQIVKLVVRGAYVGKRVPDTYVNEMLPIPASRLQTDKLKTYGHLFFKLHACLASASMCTLFISCYEVCEGSRSIFVVTTFGFYVIAVYGRRVRRSAE